LFIINFTAKFYVALAPKLRLGNPVGEAPASRDGKLELPKNKTDIILKKKISK